jgi:hypothetical protein
VATPAPAQVHGVAADFRGDAGLDGGQVRGGLLRALNAEGFTDTGVVIRAGFDLLYQRHGGDRRGKGRERRQSLYRLRASIAQEVLPARPLLGGVLHRLLTGEHIAEVISVGGLAGHLLRGHAQDGTVSADAGLKELKLCGELFVARVDEVGFRHGCLVLGLRVVGWCWFVLEKEPLSAGSAPLQSKRGAAGWFFGVPGPFNLVVGSSNHMV